MRNFCVVLLLAATAIGCKFAVQSGFLAIAYPAGPLSGDIRATLPVIGLTFPRFTLPPALADPKPATHPHRILQPLEMNLLIHAAATKHRVPAAFVKSI